MTMHTIDRRTFLSISSGAAALALLPLSGCGGGEDSYPPVSSAGVGPAATATNGRQFQALGQAHTLLITELDGRKNRCGGLGFSQGKLNFPAGVAVVNGLAYVIETGNHRIQIFDAAGTALGTFGEADLLYPSAIAANSSEIFVSDARNARIVVYTLDGRLTRVIGAGVLSAPRGIALLENSLLVADPGLRKVLKFSFDGQLQMELGSDWVLPYDVATDGNFIYVADVSKNELAVVSLSGNRASSIALTSAPVNVWFRGGSLYFSRHA